MTKCPKNNSTGKCSGNKWFSKIRIHEVDQKKRKWLKLNEKSQRQRNISVAKVKNNKKIRTSKE